MNLSESAVVLRPRTVAEVVDLAFRVTFSLALSVYTKLAAFTLLPALAAVLAFHYVLEPGALLTWAVAFALAIWLEAPFSLAASRLMFREEPTVKQTLSRFGRRAMSYTGALLYKSFLLALAALPLFLPLLVIGPRALFVTEASLLEQAGPTDAWSRSKRLVEARGGEAIGAFFAWLVVRVGFIAATHFLCGGVFHELFRLQNPFGRFVDTGVTPYALLGLFLSTPFVATARFLQHIDTRTRSDGWDIQVRFMAILARDEKRVGGAAA